MSEPVEDGQIGYRLRLQSGRIVNWPNGGFYWYYTDGQGAGSVAGFDYIVGALARSNFGGVGLAQKFGDRTSVTEFIPASQIEAVIRGQTEPRPQPRSAPSQGPYR